MSNKLIVGITPGDGNGVGYEVIIKTFADERILDMCTPVIYGSSKLFGFYRKNIHNIGNINTNVIASAKDVHPKRVNIVNCLPDNVYVEPGQPTPESAKYAMTSLNCAVEDIKAGLIDVLVTAPVSKLAMVKEGFGYTGHTEFLAHQFDTEDVAMIMVSENMKLSTLSNHIPVSKIPETITQEAILKKLHILNDSLIRDFDIQHPKIAVLGLNPHSGDHGLLGEEEEKIIFPAVLKATEEGIDAFGPYSPDGFFGSGKYSRFDLVLAMYHDQGLPAFKALAYGHGVNFTAGLPIVRTSPGHGAEYELAGRDIANPSSFTSALYAAIDIHAKRTGHDELLAGRVTVEAPDAEIKPRGGRIIE